MFSRTENLLEKKLFEASPLTPSVHLMTHHETSNLRSPLLFTSLVLSSSSMLSLEKRCDKRQSGMMHGTIWKIYTQTIPTIRSEQFWEARLRIREQLLGHHKKLRYACKQKHMCVRHGCVCVWMGGKDSFCGDMHVGQNTCVYIYVHINLTCTCILYISMCFSLPLSLVDENMWFSCYIYMQTCAYCSMYVHVHTHKPV